jgi:signal transduction histidine kinase
MSILIPLIAIIVGALFGAFIVYRRNHLASNNKEFSAFAGILASLDAAYYRRDIESGREECSAKLRQMFALGDFDNFVGLCITIKEPYTKALKQAIVDVELGKSPVVIAMNMDDNKRQIECTATGVQDESGKLTQIILWFRDVTVSQKQQMRLVKENEQLKRDVKQLSSILNVLPTPVWLRSVDFFIRYCNLAYSEAAEESIEDKSEHETLELHPAARKLAKEAFESGEIKSERRHTIIGGERKLYQFTEIPLKTDGIVVGLAQDVTELEMVREELQRHITAQSELLESVTSAMAVFSADMRLKFYNYAYVHLWGFDEVWLNTEPTYSELLEELREKRRLPEQANFPQFKQRHLKMFTDLIEPREEIFYLPDGRTLRVLAIPHALGGILFAYEDVTDRLALERSYNTLIAVQKASLDNLHEGVVVFGENGRLRLYNPKFLQLWKLENAVLSPETHIADLIEKTRALHHSDDWDGYKQNFIAQLQVREVQVRRMERTNSSVVDSVVVPLPDGSTLITFSDVTDSMLVERSLRERNEALQEADRLKTEFLANVSYELRSPLTSISGFSEMLTQDYFGELSVKQREYVSGIHQASQQLMHLINDILDIASIEAGYMKLDVSEFDVHTMLQGVVALVHERIRTNKLQFTFDCPRRIGVMLADETRMKQIIFNLLSNAIKYSEIGGKIALSAELVKHDQKENEEILFIVEDNGIGITPEEQHAVFDKFYKGSNIGIHKSGAGLGLSMVKSFIELHGGRVELASRQDEGTKIMCYMPRRNQRLLEYVSTNKAA